MVWLPHSVISFEDLPLAMSEDDVMVLAICLFMHRVAVVRVLGEGWPFRGGLRENLMDKWKW